MTLTNVPVWWGDIDHGETVLTCGVSEDVGAVSPAGCCCEPKTTENKVCSKMRYPDEDLFF